MSAKGKIHGVAARSKGTTTREEEIVAEVRLLIGWAVTASSTLDLRGFERELLRRMWTIGRLLVSLFLETRETELRATLSGPRWLVERSVATMFGERPGELHPQPLTEPYGSLSTHTAPIKQTSPPSRSGMVNGFAALIRLLLFPVERRIQLLDPTPLLQPRYRPSSLLRVAPPQRSVSVLSPRGCCHLCFSLCIRVAGSRSSA
jgi:hypothetical protein